MEPRLVPQVGLMVARIIDTAADYFQLPNDLNALVCATGTKNYNLSSEFFIAAMPIGGTAVVP
jgi:hypothetical protein